MLKNNNKKTQKTCVSEQTYGRFKEVGDQLIQTDVKLQDYNKKPLDVKGVGW